MEELANNSSFEADNAASHGMVSFNSLSASNEDNSSFHQRLNAAQLQRLLLQKGMCG